MKEDELEVKFYINRFQKLETRLQELDANLIHSRTYELNLRFDTPSGELTQAHRVLRLRQDVRALLTYKGPSRDLQDVTARQEIEFQVSDFQAARRLLEALGYGVSVSYEKYRTTYDLEGVYIMLDELPFGRFCEVEGPDPASIQAVAAQLGLDWSARIWDSYLVLFTKLRERIHLPGQDLVFRNFEGMQITPEQLGVRPADAARSEELRSL